MTMRVFGRLRIVGLAAVAGLLATSVVPVAAQEDDPSVLTVGLLQDVDSLNPFAGIVLESFEVWGLTYDSLIGYSQDELTPVPALAESWEESDDGTTWTYQIRDDAVWSDGTPLTAADAAYTLNRIINGDAEQTNWGSFVDAMTSAEATDDTTLVVTVDRPSPVMNALTLPILPEHIWTDVSADETTTYSNEPLIGSGPFTLIEYRPGQFLRFEANADYWAGAPVIDELVLRIFGAEDALVQALRKGEVDIVSGLSSTTFASLEGVEGITPLAAASTGFEQIGFNTGAATTDGEPIGDGHPAFTDPEFRRALAPAVDRDTIAERLYGGLSEVGTTVIPPVYADLHYTPDETFDFDLDEANRLLDEAGYARGDDGVRRMPDGTQPLTGIRYFSRSESPTSQKLAPFVQEWFADLGIEVEIDVVDENRLIEINGDGTYEIFDWGWSVDPDPDFMLSVFLCDSRSTQRKNGNFVAGLSDSHYCNPDYDDLYAQQARETDPAARAEIVKQMQAILYDDVPYIINVYNADLQAYRSDRWTNVAAQPTPDGPIIFQFGTFTYRQITPLGEATPAETATPTTTPDETEASSSSSALVPVLIGVALLAAIGAGVALVRRRRGSADDRE
jgi:peptide/nickel transport system substrate-binding protein